MIPRLLSIEKKYFSSFDEITNGKVWLILVKPSITVSIASQCKSVSNAQSRASIRVE